MNLDTENITLFLQKLLMVAKINISSTIRTLEDGQDWLIVRLVNKDESKTMFLGAAGQPGDVPNFMYFYKKLSEIPENFDNLIMSLWIGHDFNEMTLKTDGIKIFSEE